MIEIFHISTDEMTVNDLTKVLLSNKFKKFVELIRVSKIVFDNSKTNNDKFNNNETSNNDKNDENFMMNYYKKADKKINFETEKAK